MLAVIQKSNQVSSQQGQLIATQDRSLRAERRSDELEAPTAMPNRQVQQLSQESAAHARSEELWNLIWQEPEQVGKIDAAGLG